MGRYRRCWLSILAWLVCIAPAPNARAESVINLAEVGLEPLALRVRTRTSLSKTPHLNRSIGFLAKGQPAEVLAWTSELYFVEARISTRQARGWVPAAALTPPPDGWIEQAQARHQQWQHHQALIARHQIAVGMSRDEVEESLGRPDTRASLADGGEADEEWIYWIYRYAPHYPPRTEVAGGTRQAISYRRVRAAKRMIRFNRGRVVSMEDDRPAAGSSLEGLHQGIGAAPR